MSYFDNYKKRVLGASNTIKNREISEMTSEFEEYLQSAVTSDYFSYTKIDELPDLDTNEKELMIINDVSQNDKTALDEKILLCRLNVNIDVGSYVYFNGNWFVIEFEENKSIQTHKKYIMRRCNNTLNFNYKGKIYNIPLSISNLTLYSKGIKDTKYLSEADAKRDVFIGSNPITRAIERGNRIMLNNLSTFRITHINDFEYTRRYDEEAGLIKWIVVQTLVLNEDDKENNVAYNPISEPDTSDVGKIHGKDFIYINEINKYKIDYAKEVEFILDFDYVNMVITKQGSNECSIKHNDSMDDLGDYFSLIARDKETKETIDIKNILVKGV